MHEVEPELRHCPHDGRLLAELGEVASEKLDIVPPKIRVICHSRKQYACDCGQCIQVAPLPAQPIPKSLTSPGLLAHVTVSKYEDTLPLYRQETILQRIGVDIPLAALASWMIKAGTLVRPLINLLRDRLLDYDIVQMDETTVQVLKESGKSAQPSCLWLQWLQRGGKLQPAHSCGLRGPRAALVQRSGEGAGQEQEGRQGLAWTGVDPEVVLGGEKGPGVLALGSPCPPPGASGPDTRLVAQLVVDLPQF